MAVLLTQIQQKNKISQNNNSKIQQNINYY